MKPSTTMGCNKKATRRIHYGEPYSYNECCEDHLFMFDTEDAALETL